MDTTTTANTEAVRKINRHMLKFIAIRVITPIAVAAACTVVSNAIEKKLDAKDQETTETE